MSDSLHFTVYCHPEPQGSSKAFVRNGRAIITSDNAKMKPYRQEVTQTVMEQLRQALPIAGKHVPVYLKLAFYFNKPQSAPKRRTSPVVKPDLDKLTRSTGDALTGVLYHDDSQVIGITSTKHYGSPERVEIAMEVLR